MIKNKIDNQKPEKSLLRIVGEGSMITTVGNLLLKFAVIASTVIILRYVSIYDYGIWQLVLSFIGFLSVFTLAGIENILLADLSKEIGAHNNSRSKAILIQAFILFIILGILTAIILFFVAPLISTFSKIDLTYFLKILSLYFILLATHRFYALVFSSHLKFMQIQVVRIINRVSYLLFLIFFILVMDKNLAGIVYAYVFSLIPALILFLKPCLKTLNYLKNVSKDKTYSLWSVFTGHGKWALFTNYFNNLFASLRPWIIGYFLGIDAVAIFSVAINFLGEVQNIVPLRQIFSPIIPRYVDDTKKFKFLYQRTIKYFLWFYIFLGIITFLIAPYFVGIFFPQYLHSLPFFNILLFSLIALPFGVLSANIFYAMKVQKNLFLSTTIPKGLSIILLPLLLRQFGLYWAAIIQVAASLSVAFTSIYFLHKIIPNISISWRGLIKIDHHDRLLLKRVLGPLLRIKKKI